jgi:malate dehydrogenase (oxaloacetate-decarboxylating)(NADP+)
MANIAIVDAQLKCTQDNDDVVQASPWWKKLKNKKHG